MIVRYRALAKAAQTEALLAAHVAAFVSRGELQRPLRPPPRDFGSWIYLDTKPPMDGF